MSDPCRLYLISPPEINDLKAFSAVFEAAFDGGDIACFQLRLKSRERGSASDDHILKVADFLLPLAKKNDVAFLINDRPDLAKKSGADGVHLGQSDSALKEARSLLGDEASIGVTCHNSVHLAMEAGEAGADYVAFGSFFPTETKVVAYHAEVVTLTQWATSTIVPSVAIGGITPFNCGGLVRAGADFVAASSAVWDAPEGPKSAVAAFNDAIARVRHE